MPASINLRNASASTARRGSSSPSRCREIYTLVDHSLSRALDKGAVAQIVVTGEANPAIFDVPPGQQMSTH